MTLLDLSIIASGGIKISLFFIYLYLYFQYRERFLGLWTLAWAFLMVKTGLDPIASKLADQWLSLLLFQFLSAASSFFLLWGTYDFAGDKLPKNLVYSGLAIMVVSDAGLMFNMPTYKIIIPSVIMYSLIYVQTGVFLLRHHTTASLSGKIAGYGFIVTGIHQLDFPLLIAYNQAHWGYVIDSFFRLSFAVAFLLTYFEKMRDELARKETQFRLLAENAKDVIFLYRLEPPGHFEYISPAIATITDLPPEAFYNNDRLIFDIVHPDDRCLLDAFHQAESETISLRLTRQPREPAWVEIHIAPVRNEGGHLIALEGIIRDITARRKLEQELFRLDRLNMVGQMAANLGHEIRNPLTTVRGYLQLLARKKNFAPYQANLALLIEELDRANSLITEYLSLSKHRLTDLRPNNINSIVESLYPLLQAQATASNQLILLELEDTPGLMLDEKEIRQLILNLARNGLEAMPQGKTLTIKTFVDNGAVILAVKDQGDGIPPGILDKIGIPFFTTKKTGTGLGLAICYSIANRHRAKLDIDTSTTGTTFYIRFSANQALPVADNFTAECGAVPAAQIL